MNRKPPRTLHPESKNAYIFLQRTSTIPGNVREVFLRDYAYFNSWNSDILLIFFVLFRNFSYTLLHIIIFLHANSLETLTCDWKRNEIV